MIGCSRGEKVQSVNDPRRKLSARPLDSRDRTVTRLSLTRSRLFPGRREVGTRSLDEGGGDLNGGKILAR